MGLGAGVEMGEEREILRMTRGFLFAHFGENVISPEWGTLEEDQIVRGRLRSGCVDFEACVRNVKWAEGGTSLVSGENTLLETIAGAVV